MTGSHKQLRAPLGRQGKDAFYMHPHDCINEAPTKQVNRALALLTGTATPAERAEAVTLLTAARGSIDPVEATALRTSKGWDERR